MNEFVDTIVHSKTFKSNTALVIAWDEDDYSSQLGCCGSVYPHGGGHIPVIVIFVAGTDAHVGTAVGTLRRRPLGK